MKTSFFFYARLVFAWWVALVFVQILRTSIGNGRAPSQLFVGGLIALVFIIRTAASHLRRIGLIVGNASADANALANRQRRQIEIPFEAGEAFDIVDATIRELPRTENIKSARDSLQLRVKVQRIDPYGNTIPLWKKISGWLGVQRNQIFATVTPRDGVGSVTLICEPEGGTRSDWFMVNDGTNLENAEAIIRAISRRIAERRRNEQATAKEAVTEKELAVAKLGLLHAKVEPHFLCNTRGSVKYLIKSDPLRAEEMLDNLVLYLRHSLPRIEDSLSTLSEELARARVYLDILQIRMGARLRTQVEVPHELKSVPFPTMMLQTLAVAHAVVAHNLRGTQAVIAKNIVAPRGLMVRCASRLRQLRTALSSCQKDSERIFPGSLRLSNCSIETKPSNWASCGRNTAAASRYSTLYPAPVFTPK